MKLKDNQTIKNLSSIEHILLRPSMYIGGVSEAEREVWMLTEDDKVEFKKVNYAEGLLKICNEVIDNSIDEGIKTNWLYSNKIKITMDKTTFSCEDNGRGIPVIQNEDGSWQCVNAVCRPMSGSNFTNENSNTIGTNGIGCKGSNIFSKKFECITCDGKKSMKIECADNLNTEKHKELKAGKNGTSITFTPDFDRFGIKEFGSQYLDLIKTRLKFLTWFFPKCSIIFNGEKINMKIKDFSALFPQPTVVVNDENIYVCVYPSEESESLTYVNGLYLRRGGNHVDYILNKLISDIREKAAKKYKTIKPADIRNRLGIVVFFKGFPGCKFDSQNKETLTNSQADITNYLTVNNFNYDKLSDKVLHTKPIIDNIVDLFKIKEEYAEKKELAALGKTKKDVSSEKYFPPIAKTGQKYLMITEGFSAFSGISPILGRKGIGYYMLRGKPKNIIDSKATGKDGFMSNQEINDLINILGLKLDGTTEDMTYDYVVVLSDADPDGVAIAGLCLTMFNKLAPNMIKKGRVCRLNTPLLIGLKGNKVEEYYFSFPNKSKIKKNLQYFYLKGLGSWTKERLDQIITAEGGMENLLLKFNYDKEANTSINNWFGKDSTERKIRLRGKEFYINNA